jgi:hypothetical protein
MTSLVDPAAGTAQPVSAPVNPVFETVITTRVPAGIPLKVTRPVEPVTFEP